jgi:hypothetical protein
MGWLDAAHLGEGPERCQVARLRFTDACLVKALI